MPKNKPEMIDYEKVAKGQLAEARRQLKALGLGLEESKTLASDLIKIRQLRLVIDDCKGRLQRDAA